MGRLGCESVDTFVGWQGVLCALIAGACATVVPAASAATSGRIDHLDRERAGLRWGEARRAEAPGTLNPDAGPGAEGSGSGSSPGVRSQAAADGSPEYQAETGGRDHSPTRFEYEVGGLEGERIDPRTLALSWSAEDARLPGNGGLDLVLGRTHGVYPHSIPMEAGNWHLDLPRITIPTSPYQEGLWNYVDGPWYLVEVLGYFNADGSWTPNKRWPGICNSAHELALHQNFIKNSQAGPPGAVSGYLFAAPITMYIPGEGAKVLLDPLPSNDDHWPPGTDFVTTDNWYVKCNDPIPAPDYSYLPLPGYIGGFTAHAPDGRVFTFDWMQWYQKGETNFGAWGGQVHLVARKVEDVNGNRLYYDYDLETGLPVRLTGYDRDDRFDGRQIDLYYDGEYPFGLVYPDNWSGAHLERAEIVDTDGDDGGNSVIRYGYCGRFSTDYPACEDHNNPDAPQLLHSVELPGGLRWKYEAEQITGFGRPTANWALTRVVTPTNAQIDYSYTGDIDNANPFALRTRRVRGTDIPDSTWTYSYVLGDHIEQTTIVGPARTDVYRFFEGVDTLRYQYAHRDGDYAIPPQYSTIAGRLQTHTVRSPSGEVLRRTDYAYGIPAPIGKYWYANHTFANREIVPVAYTHQTLMTERRVLDYTPGGAGRAYRTLIALEDYDIFGMPQVVDETGDDGAVEGDDFAWKRTSNTWRHLASPWRVGLLERTAVWDDAIAHDYDALGRRIRTDRYGIETRFTWNPDGTLASRGWTRDGTPHAVEYFDYHRGVAQIERHPVDVNAGESILRFRKVDDFGRVTRETDGAGQRTEFGYDGAGRLTSVVPPGFAASAIRYEHNANGRWFETRLDRGGYSRRTTLDTLGRAILERDYNGAVPAEYPVATAREYDASGRVAKEFAPFEYSGSGAEPGAVQTAFAYDALDRTLRVTHPDGAITRYCYRQACNTGPYALFDATLENGYIVTDERGYQSGYEFRAFGDPDARELTRIVQQVTPATAPGGPEFVVTRIGRTALGEIDFVSQGDGDPANTVTRDYVYDARNLLARIHHPETGDTVYTYDEVGNRLTAKTGSSGATRYRYDGRNRLIAIDHAGSAPDVTLEWTATDLLARIDNGIARRDYAYTSIGTLRRETLTAGGASYTLEYPHTALGDRAGVRYPDGEYVGFATDSLGRPRQLGGYVSRVNYFPSGRPRRIDYANGVQTLLGETVRGLPGDVDTTGPAGVLVALDYEYDPAGQLVRIGDGVVTNNTRALGYDGLGRLISASGQWGDGELEYDPRGNLTRKRIGSHDLRYAYDARERLASINGGAFAAFRYDARGNVIGDGTRTWSYNGASQLVSVDAGTGPSFAYDGHDVRTLATRDGKTSVSGYNRDGLLMFDNRCVADNTRSNYIYLQTTLVAKNESECDQGCHP